jgi:hypothetical protein
MTKNLYGEQITIEVVGGGFILTYPVFTTETTPPRFVADGESTTEVVVQAREVFVSPRKLNQKLKEVIASVSLVADEE